MTDQRRSTYRAFQGQIYAQGMFQAQHPAITTDPNKLEEQARSQMSARSFAYVAGGAGERATMDANRLAFRQWRLIPRMLRDASQIDTSVDLFGTTYPSPLLMAPIGVQGIFHTDAEVGVAGIAAQLRVPYVMSTASTASIEEVAAANCDGETQGVRWYQLYWPKTDEITISLLGRAKKEGFKVLVVTLDTFSLAWRPWDLDLGYLPFVKGVGNKVGLSDPVFRRIYKENTGKEVEEDITASSLAWQMDAFSGKPPGWEKLQLLKDNWDGPIVLKGIQHVDDARKAVEMGMSGIIVSNHGGRQLDGAIASLEVLPEIVDAVGDKITVLFDSGIRTGVDVIKALCLGAKAVLVGRPWVYGLGIDGKEGAKQVVQGILADMDQSMNLAGIRSINECQRGLVRKVSYGERHSSN
jgi:isopentenyl diphosphate isomerase/L-lactate dehydrogenase-like FMN-dependent dehydrogenase